jgi:hypothetical protein
MEWIQEEGEVPMIGSEEDHIFSDLNGYMFLNGEEVVFGFAHIFWWDMHLYATELDLD